jgi:hypothetical protein
LPPPESLHEHVDMHVDEVHGTLKINVELPYLSYAVHYIIDFVAPPNGKETAPQSDRCSTEYSSILHDAVANDIDVALLNWDEADGVSGGEVSFGDGAGNGTALGAGNIGDQLREVPRRYNHAPNAKYAHAFSSRDNYTAYYVDPKSRWSAHEHGCARVIYSGEFNIPDGCGNFERVTTNEADNVRRFAGTLRVRLFSAYHPGVYWQRETAFALYVDKRNNKVLLANDIDPVFDIELLGVRVTTVPGTATRRLEVALHSLTEYPLAEMPFTLVNTPRFFTLAAEPLAGTAKDASNRRTLVMYADVAANTNTLDERVSFLFQNPAGTHYPPYRAHLTLMLAQPRNVDYGRKSLSVVTQHTDGDGRSEKSGAVHADQRVCMTTMVKNFNKVARTLEVELLDATVCAVNEAHHDKQCSTIFDAHPGAPAPTKTQRARNVTVSSPGPHGPASVQVCFRAHVETKAAADNVAIAAGIDGRSHGGEWSEQHYKANVRLGAVAERIGKKGGPVADVFNELAHFSRHERHHVVLDSRFGVEHLSSSSEHTDRSHKTTTSAKSEWTTWFGSASIFDAVSFSGEASSASSLASSSSASRSTAKRSEVTQQVFRVMRGNPNEFREGVPRRLGGSEAVFAGTVFLLLIACVIAVACCVERRSYAFMGQ